MTRMSRRTARSRALLGLLLVLTCAAPGCGSEPAGGSPERIVLIVIDTLRRDYLSCYGGAVPTPHIDELARRGQIFEQAYSSFHQTTMSMASLFTGRTPSMDGSGGRRDVLPWTGKNWCGLSRFATPDGRDACVPRSLPTLAERMREAGYETLGVQSNPLLFDDAGFSRGFDSWAELGVSLDLDQLLEEQPPLTREEQSAERVLDQVEAVLAGRQTDRFFLYVHLMDVHDYAAVRYEEGVRRADLAVGRLLEHLDAEDLSRGAVFILTSDHGERLGERKVMKGMRHHFGNPSFEELLRVPLIVAPAVFEDVHTMVRGDQLFQMLEELAGLSPTGAADLEDGELFLSERGFLTYRKGKWKSYQLRKSGRLVLIDLEADPNETADVSQKSKLVQLSHRRRTQVLVEQLGTAEAPPSELTDQDRARLQALGYLQAEEEGLPE
jgi:arylsulfatase A-like enzyme